MNIISKWPMALGVLMALVSAFIATHSAQAATFTSIDSFDNADGSGPVGTLVQASDGSFYGITANGGANEYYGTVFKITPTGTLASLYSFCSQTDCTDGSFPQGGLVQAEDGDLYGTTTFGGTNDEGTIFKISTNGTLTTLHSFHGSNGKYPYAALIQAANGEIYGTTSSGGAHDAGTIFKITSGGTVNLLHSFDTTDGKSPQAAIIQATNGDFYGTTYEGGANDVGTVFKITLGGALTVLHSFDTTDGKWPQAALIQANDGNLYGTTSSGGANKEGTVFKITPTGSLTLLHSFDTTDGASPVYGLTQATNGVLYGTTPLGGAHKGGTIFKIDSGGAVTTLHNFAFEKGKYPDAALLQATNGDFYGTASGGGASPDHFGTIFSLSVGLGPFVEAQTSSGSVGSRVVILGDNLTGATSVTFNGTAAAFMVVAASEITATVPTGATTGYIGVTTPSDTLKSNVKFRVTP